MEDKLKVLGEWSAEFTYRKKFINEQFANFKKDSLVLKQRANGCLEALGLFRAIMEKEKERIKSELEQLATYGVQEVFGEGEIILEQEVRAGRVINRILVNKNGETREIMTSEGGGMVNVVAFILRVIILILEGQSDKILVLDEPFSNVSEEYRDNVNNLVRSLVDRLNIQVIMVTHSNQFLTQADMVYSIDNGEAKLIYSRD